MPIQSDISVPPYFDDYTANSPYYKVLFKPSVAVQVRELNQLQSMLQSQVERFGDSVYKRGTIIDGCNFTFIPEMRHVKIRDNEVDGAPVNVQTFKNMVAKDSTGLTAYIVETAAGFESQAPDLNTLFIRYTNSGNNFEKTKFEKNNVLTIIDQKYPISKALVNEGSSGFANIDPLIIYPAIALQNTIGGALFAPNTWVINSKIIQDTTGAEAEILAVDTTSNTSATILRIRPLESDLDDTTIDANNWTFESGYTITSANYGATTANTSANAVVTQVIGSGAAGSIVTDSTGKIIQIAISAGGRGYYVPPHITVASPTGAIEAANIEAYNYIAKVLTQNDDAAAGNTYALSVSEGIIYQKGYFSRVSQQLAIIEKYSTPTTPDFKVVGFDTLEEFIDSNDDQTLLDNATGSFNETAPGADRLKLTPVLTVLTKPEATSNTNFLPLIEFSKGKPFKQTRVPQFSKIAAELAQRTYEESGNYVINQFASGTRSPIDTSETTTFDVVVDPGVAYIKGYRVESVLEYTKTLNKGTSTVTRNDVSVDLNYGSYIRVNDLGGYFQFNTGDVVSLRNAVADYTANSDNAGTTLAAPGSEIGKARMRSLVYESGEPGSSAVYRLYIFDIAMNTGANFSQVKSVYYDGATYKGYGDVVLEGTVAKVYETNKNSLIFPTGYSAVKNATSISYTYRSVNATATSTVGGMINVAPTTGVWSYSGELTTSQLSDIIAVPLANLETINVTTASVGAGANVNNTSVVFANTTFAAAVKPGDFIKIIDTSGTKLRKIVGIINSTAATIDKGPGFTNATSNVAFICPAYVPLQLNTRTDRSANVNGSYLRIYVNPPADFTSTATVAVTYNASRNTIAPTTKNTFRKRFVKIRTANNTANTVGPWYLGVPDIFRLRKVYLANTSTVNTNSTDVTANFFIDHNQTENYYDNGYLFKKPNTSLVLTSNDYLLVQYDAYDKTDGLYTVSSYNVDDAKNLTDLSLSSANVHTVEIPEMYTSRGEYYDLRDCIDFRVSANTLANTAVTTAGDSNMTINPAEPAYADKIDDTTEKHFPVPQSDLTFNSVYYQGRSDRLVMNANGDFVVLTGDNGKFSVPREPVDAVTINIINIPPYPSIPQVPSANTIELLDTSIANIRYVNKRRKDYSISQGIDRDNIEYEQNLAYKMSDIASMDRRLRKVEYRIDLRDTEDTIKSKSIASSVDATLERFKLGFFVDNFTSVDYSDLEDPEYSAMNFNYRMTSMKKQINIKYKFAPRTESNSTFTSASIDGKFAIIPYSEHLAVQQQYATAPPVTANTVTNQQTFIYEYRTSKQEYNEWLYRYYYGYYWYDGYWGYDYWWWGYNWYGGYYYGGYYYDPNYGYYYGYPYGNAYGYYNHQTMMDSGLFERDVSFTFSAAPGPTTLYLFPWGADRFEVHQSSNPNFEPSAATLFLTSESATEKTPEDDNYLLSVKALNLTKKELTQKLGFKKGKSNPKFYLTGTGKLTWTHDPTKGIYYKVRVQKGTGYVGWRLEYPADSNFPEFTSSGSITAYKGTIVAEPSTLVNTIKIHSVMGKNGYVSVKEGAAGTLTIDNQKAESGSLVFDAKAAKAEKISLDENTKLKISDNSVGPHVVRLEIRGLKPLTKHNVLLDGKFHNSKTRALSGRLSGETGTDISTGGVLVSDETGKLTGEIYIDNGVPDDVTETEYSKLLSLIAGTKKTKTIKIVSSDDSSLATIKLVNKVTFSEEGYLGYNK